MASDHPHPLVRPLVPPPEALASLRVRFLVLAFWIVMGAMETAKELTTARLQGIERTVGDAILVNFPWWFFWVAGTLLVVTLAERWPIDRPGRRIRPITAHAFTGAALSVAHLTLVGVLVFFTVARGRGTGLGAQIEFWVQGYVVIDFFVYWMVLGAYYALLYHQRWVEGALRESEASARAMRLEAEGVGAKLRALQMELNPHFLFNALNAVSGLVEEGRSSEATTVIARLGELLRTTLRRGDQREVSLEEELALVGLYLDMERIRFGPRLDVRIEQAHADVLAARVPPMILQPLVENAVRHGAAKARGPVGVRIRARREGQMLRVVVEDDGPGWPPSTPPAEGTGLSNVSARLETLYGADASLSLSTDRAEPATRAEVSLPFRNGAERTGPISPTSPARLLVPLVLLLPWAATAPVGAQVTPARADSTSVQLLFSDDFEQGLGRWHFPLGTGHAVVQTTDGGRALALETRDLPVYALIAGSDEWRDVRVEGRVLFPGDDDSYLGFIYRFVDDGRRMDFGSLYIKGNDSYVQANPHLDTNVGRTLYPELRAPLSGGSAIEIGRWRRFALEVVGGEAHLYVGDAEMPVLTVPFGAEPSGAFGFKPRNPGGAVWIDDIVVRPIDRFSYAGAPIPEVAYRPEAHVTAWEVLGPLTRTVEEVEASDAPRDLTIEDDGRTVGWMPLATDPRGAVITGRITDFRGSRSVAYLRASIESERAGPATLVLSTADAVALWLNGSFLGFGPSRGAAWWDAVDNPDRDVLRASAHLQAGRNTLLVRVIGGTYGSGGFFLSVRPDDDRPSPGS